MIQLPLQFTPRVYPMLGSPDSSRFLGAASLASLDVEVALLHVGNTALAGPQQALQPSLCTRAGAGKALQVVVGTRAVVAWTATV